MDAERVKELLDEGERMLDELSACYDCTRPRGCFQCDSITAAKDWTGFAELRSLLSTAAAEMEKLREHLELVCRERDLLREEVKGLRASGAPAES